MREQGLTYLPFQGLARYCDVPNWHGGCTHTGKGNRVHQQEDGTQGKGHEEANERHQKQWNPTWYVWKLNEVDWAEMVTAEVAKLAVCLDHFDGLVILE